MDALDLVIGSDGEDIEHRAQGGSVSASPRGETEDGGEDAVIIPTRKKRKSKKALQAAAAGEVASEEPKFVELTKLLPFVPKKGNFEVNTVKKSLYFFS